jgi:hypothetical protein
MASSFAISYFSLLDLSDPAAFCRLRYLSTHTVWIRAARRGCFLAQAVSTMRYTLVSFLRTLKPLADMLFLHDSTKVLSCQPRLDVTDAQNGENNAEHYS